jgi:hypothetical protein
MAIYDVWLDSMGATEPHEIGNSVTATLNLGGPASAVAQGAVCHAETVKCPHVCYVRTSERANRPHPQGDHDARWP